MTLDSYTHQGCERYARERVREATAVYFGWLAQKETPDYDRRQRLLEVAGFYRSLAGIIPAMPTQYKIKIGPSLTRAERTPALNYRRHSHGSSWGLGVWVITLAIRGHMLELLGINVVRMKKH